MRALLLSLLFLLALPVSAQRYELRLTVVDKEDGEALPAVTVQLEPGGAGGITDTDGGLRLQVTPGRYTLRATFVGYADYERKLDMGFEDRELTIRLEETSATLSTVTVTDRGAQEALRSTRMGVERLSGEELEAIPAVLGEADALRGLQLLPGVSSAGEASNGISVRGGTVDQNLLLLDGAPVFAPTHLFGLFTVFTPGTTGSLDLYRGNIPARFGGRVSSVVDVRTRTPTAEETIITGGVGLVSSNVGIETPLGEKWGLLAAARGGFNDFAFGLVERLRDTRSRFGDATVKLRYRAGENDFVTATGFYAQDFYSVDLLANVGGVPATSNEYAYLTLNGGLEWAHFLPNGQSLTGRVTNAHYAPEIRFPQEDGSRIDYSSGIDQLSTQLRWSAATGSRHAWEIGTGYDRYRLQPGALDPGGSTSVTATELAEETGTELSFFAADEWTVSDRFALSGGLRYVYYDEEYGGVEPRAGASLRIGSTASIKASYARSRQYLHNIYNATTPLPTSRWVVSSSRIAPQTADLVSLGYTQSVADGNYLFRLEGYHRTITDIIEYRPGADFFLNPTVADDLLRGEGRAYGLELSATKRAGRLRGELNYAYARVENRVTGDRFRDRINRGNWYPGYFDQPHTLSTNLTFDAGTTHELAFNFVAQTNRPYTVPNGFVEVGGVDVPLFLERNNGRLPVYHRLDFSWTIHNLRRKSARWVGDWVFTVYNVYGRNNAYNIYFQPRDARTPPLGIFARSPFAAYRLSIFGAPVFSLSYKFTFRPGAGRGKQ